MTRRSTIGLLVLVFITSALAGIGWRTGQMLGARKDAAHRQHQSALAAVSPPRVIERLGPGVETLIQPRAAGPVDELQLLAVVSEPQSARYRFLAKRRYLAHLDADKVGTLLDATDARDKLLIELSSEVKRRHGRGEYEPLERQTGATLYVARALVDSRTDAIAATAIAAIGRPALDAYGPLARKSARYGALTGLTLGLLLMIALAQGRGARLVAALRTHSAAYAYISPAAVGMLALVLAPFAFGMALSLFHHDGGGSFSFTGLTNFKYVLFGGGPGGGGLFKPQGFYFTLGVTILWTALNVFLHAAIGLALALILRDPLLRLRGFYRVLFILPWAIPNYITALIWKGMFHRQYGAINKILETFGAQPVDWFSSFVTAFAANLCANTWLGFPFMMVVCLGALESIPRDLYEAADVDGAGWWDKFKSITLPMIKPALFPAIILGSIWTFNMFNVIFLVSGGEPRGSTEILITEAYRWAFKRGEQYGIAAAYGVIIFLILLAYSWLMARTTRATEAVYE